MYGFYSQNKYWKKLYTKTAILNHFEDTCKQRQPPKSLPSNDFVVNTL